MKKQTLLESIASLVLRKLDERYDTIGQKYIAYFDIYPNLQYDDYSAARYTYEVSPPVNIEEKDFDELDIEALDSELSMEYLMDMPEMFDQIHDSYTKKNIKNFIKKDWNNADEFAPLGVSPGVKMYYVKDEEDGSIRYRGIITGMENSKDAVKAVKQLIKVDLEQKPGLDKYVPHMRFPLDRSQN